jgi:hypothetical protein
VHLLGWRIIRGAASSAITQQQQQPLKSLYGRCLRYVLLHLLVSTVIELAVSYNGRMLKQAKPVYAFVFECHQNNQMQDASGLIRSEMTLTYRHRIH